MKYFLIFSSIFILSSCSSFDRTLMSEFEPLPKKSFKFKSKSDLIYPEDSEGAEKIRMDWLETYLTDNNICAGGYVIEERKVVLVSEALIGPGKLKDIYYYGRCT